MVDVELKDGYNKTTLGLIPNEWKLKQIGDVIEFQGGAQPPKEKFINEPKEGYIRLIQIRDYKTDNYKTYIPKEMARKFCAKDDIMIGRYGPPIFQILYGLEGAYNVALLKAIPNEEVLNKEYARFFLSTEKLFELIDRLSQRTSGQTGIDMEALNNYLIPIPTLKEQEKIAKILSTVDSQIDDTDKIIEKTKELKKGLMQRLLTKGIGHKEFKVSEVGDIPSEWEIKDLNEISNITRLAGAEYSDLWEVDDEGAIIALRGFNIGENKLILNDTERISEELSNRLIRSKLFKGDIVFPCVGTIGKATVISQDNTYHINQNIAKITPKDDVYSLYLSYFLISDIVKKQILKYNTSSSQPNVLVGNLRQFKIIVPKIKEQKQIVNILVSVDSQIDDYKNKKNKLEELKKGLIQQLLTGKVRVK